MKQPQLVGLNDYLADVDYNNIKSCLAQFNPATDKAIDINSISCKPQSDSPERIKDALNIWGNLFNVKNIYDEQGNIVPLDSPVKKQESGIINNFDYKGNQLIIDTVSPYYAQLKAGGIFTDKFNNKIYIVSQDNEIAMRLMQRGYFGKEGTDYETFKAGHENKGGGWKEAAIWQYAAWEADKSDSGAGILAQLERMGINKQKRKPILVFVDRDAGIALTDVIDDIVKVAIAVVNIIPGIGPVLAAAISAGAQYLANYIKNPDYKPTTQEYLQMGNALLPNLASGDSDISKYLSKGTEFYQAIENKDYKFLANHLGISDNLAKLNLSGTFQKCVRDNDVKKILDVSGTGGTKLNFNQINAELQVNRNLKLPKQFVDVTTNKQSKYLEELYLKGLDKSQDWQNFLVNYAGGGFISALPTLGENGEDGIKSIMNIDNSWATSPEIHKAYINMATSLPTGTAAFDELLLANIEEQLAKSTTKSVTLPAQIPAEKAQCIAEELSANGYQVITSEYQATIYDKNKKYDTKKIVLGKDNSTNIGSGDFSKSIYRSEWR